MNKKRNALTEDLVGKKFNRLTVIEYSHSNNGAVWLCKCDCGSFITAKGKDLKNGKTKSCGCFHRDCASKLGKSKKTHGQSNTRLYYIWRAMKERCFNKNSRVYNRYGGRGITVCDEWANSFEAFYKWSINNGYSQKLTLDRIDNDGIYEPDNCRWTTMKVQNQNKSKPAPKEFYKNQYGIFRRRESSKVKGVRDDDVDGEAGR